MPKSFKTFPSFFDMPSSILFIPEKLPPEAHLMARTMEDFLRKEVLPQNERLQQKEPGLMRALLQKAGSLGLLAGNIPQEYDGLDLPKMQSLLLTERAAADLSFGISWNVHSSVATLPLVLFGTQEQQQRYLPQLANGQLLAAFALSEPESGSDALAAHTQAHWQPSHNAYRLSGTKMWVTNGGFADIFTLFAYLEGQGLTAFLVESNLPGLELGKEEHKMGLHGSSTCRLSLQDVDVSGANLLGEPGKGHHVALYTLNAGRLSIAALSLGGAKECLRLAARYALQRKQFGKPIAHFGLIRSYIAQMAAAIYSLESLLYRTAALWDDRERNSLQPNEQAKKREAAKSLALECAIAKFFGSEVLGFTADSALQIHGGYGYSEEFAIARFYRDARVFRIFEGTNEINRLSAAHRLLQRSALFQQKYQLLPSVPELLLSLTFLLQHSLSCLVTLPDIPQQALAALADMACALYTYESGLLRAAQLQGHQQQLATLLSETYAHSMRFHIAQKVSLLTAALPEGQARTQVSKTARSLLRFGNTPILAIHESIAHTVLDREGYPFP